MKNLILSLIATSTLLILGGLSIAVKGQTNTACNSMQAKLRQYNEYVEECIVVERNTYSTLAGIGGKGKFYYNRQNGQCITVNYYGNTVQNLNSCRKSWYAIGRVSSIMFFLDRSAGEVETYKFSYDKGLLERVQRIYSLGNKAIKSVAVSTRRFPWGYEWTLYIENDRGSVDAYRVDTSTNKLKLVRTFT